jgi:hypothetical protein
MEDVVVGGGGGETKVSRGVQSACSGFCAGCQRFVEILAHRSRFRMDALEWDQSDTVNIYIRQSSVRCETAVNAAGGLHNVNFHVWKSTWNYLNKRDLSSSLLPEVFLLWFNGRFVVQMFIFQPVMLLLNLHWIKAKDKIVRGHAVKAYRGSEVIAPLILYIFHFMHYSSIFNINQQMPSDCQTFTVMY